MIHFLSNKKVIVTTAILIFSAHRFLIQAIPNQYGWDNEKNYIDFDVSMQSDKYPKCIGRTRWGVGIQGDRLLDFFRNLYNKNNLSQVTTSEKPKIPKIIHHVWLGGPVPETLQKYVDSVKKLHPDWEHKLWTDKEAASITLDNQKLFDTAQNLGEKSDILRYEVLYRYGGVYVDTDIEGLKQFDILNYCYDFYIGIQPLDSGFLQLGIGIIGSTPGHPILKHMITNLPKNCQTYKKTVSKTGPFAFTASFFLTADKQDTIDIAFPASYFYPIDCEEPQEEHKNKIKSKNLGAFCIHWWGKTWLPTNARKEKFQSIKNADAGPDETSWHYVDFDTSLSKRGFAKKHKETFFETKANKPHPLLHNITMTNAEIINEYKKTFDDNNLSVARDDRVGGIPKIIHQIWLGSELPDKYKTLQRTFFKKHPQWRYKLWTDKDVEHLNIHNKKLFDNAKTYAAKANILRAEILYQFGGVYADTDVECFKPLDVLHDNYQFYCGMEHLQTHPAAGATLGTAIIGSIPGHPILKYYIENVQNNVETWENKQNFLATLPKWAEQCSKTGTNFFTKSVLEFIVKHKDTDAYKNMIILPTTYFYPPLPKTRASIERLKKLFPETFCIHYWSLTWLDK